LGCHKLAFRKVSTGITACPVHPRLAGWAKRTFDTRRISITNFTRVVVESILNKHIGAPLLIY
jgi:hypothetical protein